MASTATSLTPALDLSPRASTRPTRTHSDFFSRVFRLFAEARQREAERVIAKAIARQGGKFTDSLERQIERNVL